MASTNSDDYQHSPSAVAAMEKAYADGFEVAPHSHPRGQLVYATSGVMRVSAAGSTWVVAPGRAIWITPGTSHAMVMVGKVMMRTLYIRADTAAALGDACRVVDISPLLRELILGALSEPGERTELIGQLIVVELARAPTVPVCICMPQDARLVKICQYLLLHPESGESLEHWGMQVGASARTLARRFRAETGLSFVEWRQQVRLAEALGRLARGEPVKRIALALGYSSASAFITMFRAALGVSPAQGARANQTSLAPSVAITPPAARSTQTL